MPDRKKYVIQQLNETTTPSDPPSNFVSLYAKSDGIYQKAGSTEKPLFPLAQANAYFVGKNGNDSNDGKSIDYPFLTIGAANTAIAARTPSASNIFVVYILDGIYTEDFTMQTYTTYYGPGAKLVGEIVAVDFSHMTLQSWDGKTSGATNLITKTAGGGTARFNILGILDLKSSDGIYSLYGAINIKVNRIIYANGDLIANGSTFSSIIIHCHDVMTNSGGNNSLINVSNANSLNIQIYCNYISDSASSGTATVIATGVTNGIKIDIRANILASSTRKIFDIGNLTTVNLFVIRFNEAAASTVTGSGVFDFYIVDEESNSNKTKIRNSQGIELVGSLDAGSITSGFGSIDIGTDSINAGQVNVDNLRLDGNTLSITDTDGDLILQENGDGGIGNTTSLTDYRFRLDFGDVESLDQQNTSSDQNASGFTYQSFTAGLSGSLTKIYLQKSTAAAASGTITIYEGTGTGGSSLASEAFSVSSVDLEVTFSTPASVTAGNVYTIGYSGTNVTFRRSTANPYAGGTTNWGASYDAVFNTYVEGGAVDFVIRKDSGFHGINVLNPTEMLDIGGNLNLESGNVFKINSTTIIQENQIDISTLTFSEDSISSSDDLTISSSDDLTISSSDDLTISATNNLTLQTTGTTGDILLQTTDAEVLDQSNTYSDQNASGFTYQSFTAGLSGSLTKIYLQKSTAAAASGTIEIRSGTGTGGSLLASEAFSVSSTDLEVTFSTPTTITASSVYSIVYVGTNVTFRRSTTNPYAGGQANWGASYDAVFNTYVTFGRTYIKIDNSSDKIGINVDSPTELLDIDGNVNLSAASSLKINTQDVLDEEILTLKETTTPSAVTNYGKIYNKNNNALYFQDGAGTEHSIVQSTGSTGSNTTPNGTVTVTIGGTTFYLLTAASS